MDDGLIKNISNSWWNCRYTNKTIFITNANGCDVIAPSDMMDGRVGKIRKSLDKNNYHDVQILSYAVKYTLIFMVLLEIRLDQKNH